MRRFDRLVDLESCIGEEIGLSDWVVIDQARIDAFAEALAIDSGYTWIPSGPQRGRSARPSRTAS